MSDEEPISPLRLAAKSLYAKYQWRIGKGIWSIGVSADSIVVFGTEFGMRDIPDGWEGFFVEKRETDQPRLGAAQEKTQ